MRSLTLTAPHPYYPALGEVSLHLQLLDQPPGPISDSYRQCTGVEWTPLSRELCLAGHPAVAERAILLGMCWDLAGQPIHPSKGRRPAGTFALVAGPNNTAIIWRPTHEMLNSHSVRIASVREPNKNIPDIRRTTQHD
jgi:hypothetical protein